MIRLTMAMAITLFGLAFLLVLAAAARVLFGVQFSGSLEDLALVAIVTTVAGVGSFGFSIALELNVKEREQAP